MIPGMGYGTDIDQGALPRQRSLVQRLQSAVAGARPIGEGPGNPIPDAPMAGAPQMGSRANLAASVRALSGPAAPGAAGAPTAQGMQGDSARPVAQRTAGAAPMAASPMAAGYPAPMNALGQPTSAPPGSVLNPAPPPPAQQPQQAPIAPSAPVGGAPVGGAPMAPFTATATPYGVGAPAGPAGGGPAGAPPAGTGPALPGNLGQIADPSANPSLPLAHGATPQEAQNQAMWTYLRNLKSANPVLWGELNQLLGMANRPDAQFEATTLGPALNQIDQYQHQALGQMNADATARGVDDSSYAAAMQGGLAAQSGALRGQAVQSMYQEEQARQEQARQMALSVIQQLEGHGQAGAQIANSAIQQSLAQKQLQMQQQQALMQMLGGAANGIGSLAGTLL